MSNAISLPDNVQIHDSIGEISSAAWNACLPDENPFLRHEFFLALEQSGSACPESGWQGRHLTILGEDGAMQAVLPLYVKGHSYGEYVFDHAWADAYGRMGGRYYPKLLAAVPFSPVTGPRLLSSTLSGWRDLLHGLEAEFARSGVSSVHLNFLTGDQRDFLAAQGYSIRTGVQYHWRNPGYRDFQDFLEQLVARKRKVIRKERQKAQSQGVEFEVLSGTAIGEVHWDAFYQGYLQTVERKWAHAYLTRDFFSLLGETMSARVVLVMGKRGGRYVCGALNLKGGDTLYGRNWASVEDFPFVHFEVCYYQAMDYAIAQNLTRVEAGAQGEHKIPRGYLPVETYSAHRFMHSDFDRAVRDYVAREEELVREEMDGLSNLGPFRREGSVGGEELP